MSELEERLNAVLSNPEEMSRIAADRKSVV